MSSLILSFVKITLLLNLWVQYEYIEDHLIALSSDKELWAQNYGDSSVETLAWLCKNSQALYMILDFFIIVFCFIICKAVLLHIPNEEEAFGYHSFFVNFAVCIFSISAICTIKHAENYETYPKLAENFPGWIF